MNTRTTNIAFIILILLLVVSTAKAQKTPFSLANVLNPQAGMNFAGMTDVESNVEIVPTSQVTLTDFDDIEQSKKFDRSIDRATAISYIETRSLNGTEMLALTKVKKVSPHLNKDKKVIVYVNKGSEKGVQAFVNEFAKTRQKFASNSSFVFMPLENFWEIDEDNIKNSHDRVVYNLKQDCGLFCIMDLRAGKLITLKGTNVSKKSAEIIDVILNSLSLQKN